MNVHAIDFVRSVNLVINMADESSILMQKIFAEKTILAILYEFTGEGEKIRNGFLIGDPYRSA